MVPKAEEECLRKKVGWGGHEAVRRIYNKWGKLLYIVLEVHLLCQSTDGYSIHNWMVGSENMFVYEAL
jgi:hypothetical protein